MGLKATGTCERSRPPLCPCLFSVCIRSAIFGSVDHLRPGAVPLDADLSRALSYNGAEFSIAKVRIDPQFQ